VEKYGRVRRETDDHKIRRLRFELWIIKARDTRSENVIQYSLLLFSRTSHIVANTLALSVLLTSALDAGSD